MELIINNKTLNDVTIYIPISISYDIEKIYGINITIKKFYLNIVYTIYDTINFDIRKFIKKFVNLKEFGVHDYYSENLGVGI